MVMIGWQMDILMSYVTTPYKYYKMTYKTMK